MPQEVPYDSKRQPWMFKAAPPRVLQTPSLQWMKVPYQVKNT